MAGVAIGALLTAAFTASAQAQTLQYRAPNGVEYFSAVDTGVVRRAQAALAVEPRNVQRFIDLGVAQSGVRQFREAIETFSRGLEIAPNEAMLYRWRGHRHLSVREFDKALADLSRGFQLDSTNYGILYHLGIVRFLRGEFPLAVDAFSRSIRRAPDAGELAGSTDWLWMSLARAGRHGEAKALLDRRPDTINANNAYTRRLQLYRGEITPERAITAADTGDVNLSTLYYGLGNWYLVKGDTVKARDAFEKSLAAGGWPSFGFIVSEVELGRLRRR